MKILLFLLKIFIFGLVLFFVIKRINYELFIGGLSGNLLVAMIVSQVAVLFAVVFLSMRLSIFANSKQPLYLESYKAIFLSMGFNIVVPGRLSELVKPIYLRAKADIHFENGLCSVFLERLSDLLIISSLALIVLSNEFLDVDLKYLLSIPLTIFISFSFLPGMENILIKFIDKIRILKIKHFLNNILFQLTNSVREKTLYVGILIGVLGWSFSFLSIYLFFSIVDGINISLQQCLIIFVVSTFAYAIPALPAGIGTYEASIVVVLTKYGYGFEKSILLALSLHIAQILLIGVVTLAILTREDVNIIKLMKKNKISSVSNQM